MFLKYKKSAPNFGALFYTKGNIENYFTTEKRSVIVPFSA